MTDKPSQTRRTGLPKNQRNRSRPIQQVGSIDINGGSNAIAKDKQDLIFTCKKCGGHNLVVTHVWSLLAGVESERWQEWGPLKDNHHWQFEFKEKIEEKADHEVQRGDFGDYEEDDSASEPEEYEIFEAETSPEGDEYFLNCESCDREIEFGWSKPDRHGLIMPVEFSDFIPSESWPDLKYMDVWQQRGWLRRTDIHPD
jgi:hypothetical protein